MIFSVYPFTLSISNNVGYCFGIIYNTLIVAPIRRLYILGPDYVGWSGKAESQICSLLTNTPEAMWYTNNNICADLLEKKITSIMVVLETLFYFLMFYMIITKFVKYVFCVRPMSTQMQNILDALKKIPSKNIDE